MPDDGVCRRIRGRAEKSSSSSLDRCSRPRSCSRRRSFRRWGRRSRCRDVTVAAPCRRRLQVPMFLVVGASCPSVVVAAPRSAHHAQDCGSDEDASESPKAPHEHSPQSIFPPTPCAHRTRIPAALVIAQGRRGSRRAWHLEDSKVVRFRLFESRGKPSRPPATVECALTTRVAKVLPGARLPWRDDEGGGNSSTVRGRELGKN